MKKLILLSCMLASQVALGDDTEIYGATGIDDGNRVNSNVIFVMDTSGSMDNLVSSAQTPYDPNTTYTGSFSDDQFYHHLDNDPDDGHDYSTLGTGNVRGCEDTRNTLQSDGRIFGHYAQLRYFLWFTFWGDIANGSQDDIRCNESNSDRTYTLYSGNYMNYHNSTAYVTRDRLDIVVDVVTDLTESLSDINLGLMRFERDAHGGIVDVAVSDIDTSGPLIRAKLDEYDHGGNTPLLESYYEAVRYFRGESVLFGDDANPNDSVDESRKADDSTTYQSPIEHTCQKNHIILFTDGAPTSDDEANSYIRDLVSNINLPSELNSNCSGNGGCMRELAYWARNTDHSTSVSGTQEITTYTIGGFQDRDEGEELDEPTQRLQDTADWGGGKFFEANNTAGLTQALDDIFIDILSTDSTFTAPAVSVNAFNASEHRDELFYALFRPDDKYKWVGNVKRYKLTNEGIVVGQNANSPAISQATGFFNEGVFDFWNNTSEADGKKVNLGGAANRLPTPQGNRNIFTHYDDQSAAQVLPRLDATGAATDVSFDMEGDTNFDHVLDWTLGKDVLDYDGDNDATETRQELGDPLHSEPIVITYGGTEENPDSTIFFGTNEGFIHGVDTETGVEEFAFLPRAMHPIQKEYFYNNGAAANKPYGMDGLITSWFYDKNRNNLIIDPSTGSIEEDEHIYLYAGMRRGGRGYYGLDVTNRNAPKMLFNIEGGVTPGFDDLGQTWSKMTITKVKIEGAIKEVLFFGGGYDENQDTTGTARTNDTLGNAIYMVDASDGTLLGWASDTDSGADIEIDGMDNSIPASVSVVDINGDGLTDYLFAVDTGGRVFRIDFPGGSIDDAWGGMIADINDDTETGNRRFYNKPNVALVKDRNLGDYLTIAIGSGHRAHPILTQNVANRFYVIKDFNPYSAPSEYLTKTEAAESKITLGDGESPERSKLYNATALMTEGVSAYTSSMQRLMARGGGWYVKFNTEGEKVLAESTTFAGAVIFTTFSPTGNTTNACGADTGLSKTYVLDQKNAMAVIDLNGDGVVDEKDSSKSLSHSGIAPRPVIIYRSGGGKTIAIGTETIDDKRFNPDPDDPDCAETDSCSENKNFENAKDKVTPKYWRQNEQ